MATDEIASKSSTQRFMGLDFETSPDALVPREETELLGRAAIDILRRRPGHQLVVDMCCGSGNLACAVAAALDDVTICASDLTDGAVALARRNVERLGLRRRVEVYQGDLFSAFSPESFGERVDLVMCNPPYISSARLDGEKAYLVQSEPRAAFDGGPYGLSLHQRVIAAAHPYLAPGGWLACEFGLGQERQIAALFKRSGVYHNPDFRADQHGALRVAMAQKMA